MLSQFHDTIAAIATPESRSALAIVRVSGPDSILFVSRIVSNPEAVIVARGGSSVYDVIRPPGSSAEIDDVVLHIFRAPRSYTGEDLIEITSHGSPVIAQEILDALIAAGARAAELGEFSRRAFFNGKIDLKQAELISIKADAASERELRGAELALAEKYDRLRFAFDELITLVALIDAEIDFGESDQIEISDFEARVASVVNTLKALINQAKTRRLNSGYLTVALTGPPNVGKSSIFNALLNFERSIVSEVPGTTRDYVEAFIDVDGFRVKLVDTAGIREAGESIEERGIALGVTAAAHADISIRVTEPGDRNPHHEGAVLLHNKIDLDHWNDGLCISARTLQGLEALHAWLATELEARESELSLVQLSESEMARLDSIVNQLSGVQIALEAAILADELKSCANGLSDLLGLNVSAASLDYIFTQMCIGK